MKVIVVANQKGGVGKTTSARHFVFHAARRLKKKTLAVDLDVQHNFSKTFLNVAEENDVPIDPRPLVVSDLFGPIKRELKPQTVEACIDLIAADPGIALVERSDLESAIHAATAWFKELSHDYEVCVVDTGPSVSNLLVVALSLGDFAVSPCKPDRDAIDGLMGFFSNVVRVRDEAAINPKLASLGVLPNQVDASRAYHTEMLRNMREAWGDGVLPVTLFERAAIDVAKDRPVWETNKGESRSRAAKEMRIVCEYIFGRMGL